MKTRSALTGLLLGLICVAQADALTPSIAGLWIHHGDWEFAPKEINEDGDVHTSANAAVINFCPNGEFRMATGVIYQSTNSPGVAIGASDGLAIYSGRWSKEGDAARVEYRLVSAEIRRIPDDLNPSVVHAATLNLVDGLLYFPFTTRSNTPWPLEFLSAARYEKIVEDEFVECSAGPH
jgi:hypothetical protein